MMCVCILYRMFVLHFCDCLYCRYYKTDIKGATEGLLKEKKVVIKDNIAIAGVPMMNGSKVLEGYVPEYDATVVTRILDAGLLKQK